MSQYLTDLVDLEATMRRPDRGGPLKGVAQMRAEWEKAVERAKGWA